jgi:hypothetical protein
MRKDVLLAFALVVFSTAMVVTAVVAQQRIVGVNVDDWFKYGDITVNWSSNNPNATLPPGSEELNETEWMLLSVKNVSGTTITFQSTRHFKNGTERIESGYLDIDTGDTENMGGAAISANLEVNDTLYTGSTVKINETVVRTYPDGVRETNHLNVTLEESLMQYYYRRTENFYWDKPTGIVVEQYVEEIEQTEEYLTTYSASVRITESSVWVIPEFPSFLILPLFMMATLLAVTVYRRKHSM